MTEQTVTEQVGDPSPSPTAPSGPGPLPGADRRELALVFTVAAVQFVNVLEFMIVMPLGPDFADALGFPVDSVGVLGAAYTGAGGLAGLLGAFFLDRFDRRRALLACMSGLVVATVLAGLATGLRSLVAARLLAGLFGGPATALSIAIVADLVPPHRRGRAMGVVMGAFSVSSIVGVPLALEAARLGGWCAPFFGVAELTVLVVALAAGALPPMRDHLDGPPEPAGRSELQRVLGIVRRPEAAWALSVVGLSMVSMFTIVPNLSAWMQFNAGWPREWLSVLYLGGGLLSLVTMTIAGRLTDRLGATPVIWVSAVWVACVMALGLLPERTILPVLAFFVLFMGGSTIRGVAVSALSSRVPPPQERAGFQSVQSAVQSVSAAAGALLSTKVLHERPDHSLANMHLLGAGAIAATLVVPLLAGAVERRVRAREAAAGA